jgi:hypothetical protein
MAQRKQRRGSNKRSGGDDAYGDAKRGATEQKSTD